MNKHKLKHEGILLYVVHIDDSKPNDPPTQLNGNFTQYTRNTEDMQIRQCTSLVSNVKISHNFVNFIITQEKPIVAKNIFIQKMLLNLIMKIKGNLNFDKIIIESYISQVKGKHSRSEKVRFSARNIQILNLLL